MKPPEIKQVVFFFSNFRIFGTIWKKQHFEEKVLELERKAGHSPFDRDKFTVAYTKTIAGHDRQTGISWNTVEYYFNTLCKNNS